MVHHTFDRSDIVLSRAKMIMYVAILYTVKRIQGYILYSYTFLTKRNV
jgi:hypothetical protein